MDGEFALVRTCPTDDTTVLPPDSFVREFAWGAGVHYPLFTHYRADDHGVIADAWGGELSEGDRDRLSAAEAVLQHHVASVRTLLGQLLPGAAALLLSPSLDRLDRRLDGEAIAGTDGYLGEIPVARLDRQHPWFRFALDKEAGVTEIPRLLYGVRETPDAFVWPLNWEVARSQGLAAFGFSLPEEFRERLEGYQTSVATSTNSWPPGLTGVLGSLVAFPVPLGFAAGFYGNQLVTQLGKLSSHLDDALDPDWTANDALAELIEGFEEFMRLDEDNLLALDWNWVVGAAEKIEIALEDLRAPSLSLDLPPWPDTNLFTGQGQFETHVLGKTLRHYIIGQSIPSYTYWTSGKESEVTSTGATTTADQYSVHVTFDTVPVVPIVYLDQRWWAFPFAGMSGRSDREPILELWPNVEDQALQWWDRTAAIREFGMVVDLAAMLLEQLLAMDDAALALSGRMLDARSPLVNLAGGTEKMGSTLGGVVGDLECWSELLDGRSLPRLVSLLWRQGVVDAFITEARTQYGTDPECVYACFPWMQNAADRQVLDHAFGAYLPVDQLPGAAVFAGRDASTEYLFIAMQSGHGVCGLRDCQVVPCEAQQSMRTLMAVVDDRMRWYALPDGTLYNVVPV